MKYRVLVQPPAAGDLDDAYRWIADRSPAQAARWLDGIQEAVLTLSSLPQRCPLAPENDAFDVEIRQLLYGDYRIIFMIDGALVRVLHIRHGARRPLLSQDLDREDLEREDV